MSNSNNNNKNKRSSHSFYREAEKSILGQNQWTPKRVSKLSLKITKYLLFTFLTVATLWGCVNEFRVQTSNNLGQGVEFYQDDDFIYPNMYSSEEVIGYTATNQEVSSGIDGKNADAETLPFDFYTFNPNYALDEEDQSIYGFSDEDWAKLNTDQLIIPSSEVYSIRAGKKDSYSLENTPTSYSYNLNSITALSAGFYLYDWDDDTTELKLDNGLFAPTMAMQPYSFFYYAQENSGVEYSIGSWTEFAGYIADKADNSADGNIANTDWQPFFTYIEGEENTVDGISSMKGIIIPTGGTLIEMNNRTIDDWMQPSSWKPVESFEVVISDEMTVEEKEDVLTDQLYTLTNRMAFSSGTGYASYDDIKNTTVTYEEEEITIDEAFSKAAEDLEITNWDTEDIDYEADFTEAWPDNSTVYGGAELMVMPIPKGFPISPSEETKTLINGDENFDGYRNEGYQDAAITDNTDRGFDDSIQNFGWMLMDTNGDIQRVYDSQEAAIEGKSLYDEYYDEETGEFVGDDVHNENLAFYGDQRRNGWGAIDNNGNYHDTSGTSYTQGTNPNNDGIYENGEQTVFDEQVKTYMNGDYYSSIDTYITIGQESCNYTFASEFAGVSTLDQLTTTNSKYRGVTPGYIEHTDGTVWETSILSDSINASGQDSWGSERVAFIGWSDWGKAWDVNFGPLYGAFVFPLAQLSMGIGEVFNYFNSPWGTLLSIFIIVFLLRGLGSLLSLRGTANQLKMQEVQTHVAKIKSKYEKHDLKTDRKMKQKQQLEIMALYRKHEINPLGSLGTIFITMPIFLSLWIIISALPAYKLTYLGNFAFSVSAFYGMFNMAGMFFLYLLIGLTVGLVQGVSSKLPTWLSNKRNGIKRIDDATKKAMKKQNRTQNIMIGVFIFMGLTVPALFAYYWICSGLFSITLELSRHWFRVYKSNRVKSN